MRFPRPPLTGLIASLALLLALTSAALADRPKVVFLTGDEEYRSEESMPMLACILRRDFDVEVKVGFSVDADGFVDPMAHASLTATEELADADLLVLFLRFRRPDEATFQRIRDYLAAGKPVVAFRTSTHAFRFTANSPHADWGYQDDPTFVHSFAGGETIRQLVGQKWITHHGHFDDGAHPLTTITLDPTDAAARHPILRGVEPFDAYSWLYHVEGGGDTVEGDPQFLLRGHALRSNHADNDRLDRYPLDNPVAWTRLHHFNTEKPARVFTTTLGHPYDFRLAPMRRLALQGILWALGREDWIPADGVNPEPIAPYEPNNSGFGRDRIKPGRYPSDFFPATERDSSRPVAAQPDFADPHAFTPTTLPLQLGQDASIALVGGGLGERLQYHPRFEALLHAALPGANLRVRNLAQSGYTAGLQPHAARASPWAFPGAERFHPEILAHRGQGHFPSTDEWLTETQADVIVGFFGFSESFRGEAGMADFQQELRAWIRHQRARIHNGEAPARLVLVSPIAIERHPFHDNPLELAARNAALHAYTRALLGIAAEEQVAAIDAFTPSLEWYAASDEPLTVNGAHLNAAGYKRFADFLAARLLGDDSLAEPSAALVAAVAEKDWMWDQLHRMRNGVHAFGRRWQPFGEFNYPEEWEKLQQMIALRDEAIHAAARGASRAPNDAVTRPLSPVTSNFTRPIAYLDEKDARAYFTLPDGFDIALFASETEFPDLANPVQLTFDNRGRLWVAVMPSYPHYQPGDTRPNDKLLILEDTDGDGRADRQITFADGLHLPIGFALQPDGSVIVSQQPQLIRLRDTDGDDRTDTSEILLTGWDSHDTHHAIGAFETGPDGALYMLEGLFLHSQVETPHGTERGVEATVWRFDPATWHLEKFSAGDYDNPWGLAFDDYGQPFLADASNGRNYWLTPMSARLPHGDQHPEQNEFTTTKVRPTAGAAFVSSRHFPADQQGDFLLGNSIGFLGLKQHTIEDNGAGFTGHLRQDLVSSSDPNFRPVDFEFAPDGSLYVADWHNALVGHMQHSARDPNRDHQHGRIWRITRPDTPLVDPPPVAGATVAQLLQNLGAPEQQTRVRSRRELRGRPDAEVAPAWLDWITSLADPEGRSLLEALWASVNRPFFSAALHERCLTHADPRVRAAAVRVLRHQRHRPPADFVALARRAAADPHPRVRAEAIALATWIEDERAGAEILFTALRHPVDQTFAAGVEAALVTLGPVIRQGGFDLSQTLALADYLAGQSRFVIPTEQESAPVLNLSAEGLRLYDLGREVYTREAHCATCHQPNGKGLAGIYPALDTSEWIRGDEERLIKLVLKGLWQATSPDGAPASVPPMTPFENLLDDEELAAVLTYVRTRFGDWGGGGVTTPDTVARVRAEIANKTGFYTREELTLPITEP